MSNSIPLPIKTLFVVVGVLIISTIPAMAQPATRRPALPRNLDAYVGEYPDKLMRVTSVKSRLKTLLGKRYTDFDTSISVQHLIEKNGDFLIASGCMPHACTVNEAAFVIDLKINAFMP